MTSKKDIYAKYYTSNIFDTSPTEPQSKSKNPRVRETQPNFEKTKDDIFNIEPEGRIRREQQPPQKERESLSCKKRKKAYNNIFGSDIFNNGKRDDRPGDKRVGVKRLENNTQRSTCFDEMRNNDEYLQDLKDYTDEHRPPQKEYDAEKFVDRESAEQRYYRELYAGHGNDILPKTENNSQMGDEEYYGNPRSGSAIYEHRKRYLKGEIAAYNDCGVDKKRKNQENLARPKQGFKWAESGNANRHFVDTADYPQNNSQINKQIFFQSNIFKNKEEPQTEDRVKQINDRIENERRRKNIKTNVMGQPYPRYNKDNNDKKLPKMMRAGVDWKSPEGEIMFGNDYNHSLNEHYGKKGPTAHQRKLFQMADSKNIDTLSGETKKNYYYDYKKPPRREEINREGFKKVENMIKDIPNLTEEQKFGIRMKASTLDFNGETDWNQKEKELNSYYKNTGKKKQEVTGKVNERKVDLNKNKNTNNNYDDYYDYTITYLTKGYNKFDTVDENEIKKMFGVRGVTVYDIRKDAFNRGDLNTVKFKVLGNQSQEALDLKIKLVEDDMNRKNYKVKIEKGEDKNFKKNRGLNVANPGGKIAIIPDSENWPSNSRYREMPDNIREKKGFSRQFDQVNMGYKRPNPA